MLKKLLMGLCLFVAILCLYWFMFVAFVKANEYLSTSPITLKF